MTSERQIAANRRNAERSTGPRSGAGKAVSACNAVRHGVFARVPVIPGVERAEEWEAHRAGILASLRPVGFLEARLAERAAELLWRLGRVARYECAVVAVQLDEAAEAPTRIERLAEAVPRKYGEGPRTLAEELEGNRAELGEVVEWMEALQRLAGLRGAAPLSGADAASIFGAVEDALPYEGPDVSIADRAFLDLLKLPADVPFEEAAWTAALVRKGLRYFARKCGITIGRLIERTRRGIQEETDRLRARVAALAERQRNQREANRVAVQREQTRRLLPDPATEARLQRYEGHLSRLLMQTLHELERMQAHRFGLPVPLPVTVEIGVAVSCPGAALRTEGEESNGFVLPICLDAKDDERE